MSSVKDAHNQAMDAAFFADRERRRGNAERAAELFQQALDWELAALAGMDESDGMSWGVLHRSAGWLALDCNQPRLAEQLACKALAGEPHPDIAEELRDLLEQANFHRHLESRGIVLSDGEIQMSLAGRSVASGMAALSDLIMRAENFQTLICRIVQRKIQKTYRGIIPKDIQNRYQTFASVPRAGSFAISLRLIRPMEEPEFPGMLSIGEVLSEFMDLMELANGAEIAEIQQKIPETPYQENFLGLAKRIAPDGERIRQVGFTTVGFGRTRSLAVTRPSHHFPGPVVSGQTQTGTPEEVSGRLLYADAEGKRKNNRIKLRRDGDETRAIIVPTGLMDDIVRPLWNSYVTVKVTVKPKQKILRLQDIWESDPDSGQPVSSSVAQIARWGDTGQLPLMLPG